MLNITIVCKTTPDSKPENTTPLLKYIKTLKMSIFFNTKLDIIRYIYYTLDIIRPIKRNS